MNLHQILIDKTSQKDIILCRTFSFPKSNIYIKYEYKKYSDLYLLVVVFTTEGIISHLEINILSLRRNILLRDLWVCLPHFLYEKEIYRSEVSFALS